MLSSLVRSILAPASSAAWRRASSPSAGSSSSSNGKELIDRNPVEAGQALQARHRDGPLPTLVGAQHRRLELLMRLGLDLLERKSLLPADHPQAIADLAAVPAVHGSSSSIAAIAATSVGEEASKGPGFDRPVVPCSHESAEHSRSRSLSVPTLCVIRRAGRTRESHPLPGPCGPAGRSDPSRRATTIAPTTIAAVSARRRGRPNSTRSSGHVTLCRRTTRLRAPRAPRSRRPCGRTRPPRSASTRRRRRRTDSNVVTARRRSGSHTRWLCIAAPARDRRQSLDARGRPSRRPTARRSARPRTARSGRRRARVSFCTTSSGFGALHQREAHGQTASGRRSRPSPRRSTSGPPALQRAAPRTTPTRPTA